MSPATPRYLIFADVLYYPNGGWCDLRGSYATLVEAQACRDQCQAFGCDWYQIVDLHTLTVVEHGPLSDWTIRDQREPTDELRSDWEAFVTQPQGGTP
jgi:hypothetical protein